MNRLTPTLEEGMEPSRLWWLVALVGLLSVAAGVILIARPSHSLKALAVVFGIFLLLDGIIELVRSLGSAENRGLSAIIGVLGIIVGIALVRHPVQGVNAIGLLVGIWLVAGGAIRFIKAIVAAMHPLLQIVLAGVEIAAGVVILGNPHIGYTTLALVTGIWLVINGIGMVVLGRAIRGAESTFTAPTSVQSTTR